MQQQTVLIVAQHGRFLAQQAHLAGHRILVADCFGDQDTVAIAERWQALNDLQDSAAIRQTLITLSQGQPCLLVYGSGVEAFFSILDTLPTNIRLLGNTADTITKVKSPTVFFPLLDQLNIPYPKTEFIAPTSDKEKWLSKPNISFGGQFIRYCDAHQISLNECYYQQYLEGKAGSALFLANGQNSQLYLLNQQFQSCSANNPFLLSGLTTPFLLSDELHTRLTTFIDRLVAETKLCGFNSMDFIVTPDNALLVLEVNPRISASTVLLDSSTSVFERHYAACLNHALPPLSKPPNQTHLHTFFAPSELIIPELVEWPSYCHDLPQPNTVIKKDNPICTAVIETSTPFKQSEAETQDTLFSLLGLLENRS